MAGEPVMLAFNSRTSKSAAQDCLVLYGSFAAHSLDKSDPAHVGRQGGFSIMR